MLPGSLESPYKCEAQGSRFQHSSIIFGVRYVLFSFLFIKIKLIDDYFKQKIVLTICWIFKNIFDRPLDYIKILPYKTKIKIFFKIGFKTSDEN